MLVYHMRGTMIATVLWHTWFVTKVYCKAELSWKESSSLLLFVPQIYLEVA